MDCSWPGSSVHGILQARILEWVAIPSPRNLSDPGIEPRSPALQADSLTSEPPGKPRYIWIYLRKTRKQQQKLQDTEIKYLSAKKLRKTKSLRNRKIVKKHKLHH